MNAHCAHYYSSSSYDKINVGCLMDKVSHPHPNYTTIKKIKKKILVEKLKKESRS